MQRDVHTDHIRTIGETYTHGQDDHSGNQTARPHTERDSESKRVQTGYNDNNNNRNNNNNNNNRNNNTNTNNNNDKNDIC